MEIIEIKEHLQSFFYDTVLTIVGSGLSCAEGMPGMGLLSKQLINNLPDEISKESQIIWNKIDSDLKNGLGLEETLLKNKPDESIELAIKNITEQYMRSYEKEVIKKVVSENKKLRFSDYVKKLNISTNGTKIITTNYDRLVEFACEDVGILVDNLFKGNYISRISDSSMYSFFKDIDRIKNNIRIQYNEHVTVYKPHGCLGWYMKDGQALYSSFDLGLENLIITPGANKYRKGYDSPFDFHRTKANEAIDNASCFVIIGYGFNDDHLETHLIRKIKECIPTLIITRDISKKIINVIKKYEITAVYHYDNKYESGTIVNVKGEEVKLKDYEIWDLGNFVKEVL